MNLYKSFSTSIQCIIKKNFIYINLKLGYDEKLKPNSVKINYHLLETSRIFATQPTQFNFHVFYKLVFGAPKHILEKLYLDPSIAYKVSILQKKNKVLLNKLQTHFFFTVLTESRSS